jgi:hypothetical protein
MMTVMSVRLKKIALLIVVYQSLNYDVFGVDIFDACEWKVFLSL